VLRRGPWERVAAKSEVVPVGWRRIGISGCADAGAAQDVWLAQAAAPPEEQLPEVVLPSWFHRRSMGGGGRGGASRAAARSRTEEPRAQYAWYCSRRRQRRPQKGARRVRVLHIMHSYGSCARISRARQRRSIWRASGNSIQTSCRVPLQIKVYRTIQQCTVRKALASPIRSSRPRRKKQLKDSLRILRAMPRPVSSVRSRHLAMTLQ